MGKNKRIIPQKDISSGIIALILIFLLIFGFYHFVFSLPDYKYCIDSCATDNELCISEPWKVKVSQSGFQYLAYEDAESCSNELSSCIRDCEG